MIAIWVLSIEPLIGGLRRPDEHEKVIFNSHYWTPYRGIEMLIRFPWKGSGGGVVYGFGVWRVKSWVKNVLNTNKYIAIFSIKWGWSSLTYLPLVVIIFEKSIILFYWTPYWGIETRKGAIFPYPHRGYWTPYRGIDTNRPLECVSIIAPYWTPYRGIETLLLIETVFMKAIPIEPLIGGLRPYWSAMRTTSTRYWTPYRGIDTFWYLWCYPGYSIEPLMGGLIRFLLQGATWYVTYWTPYRGIDTQTSHAVRPTTILLNPL